MAVSLGLGTVMVGAFKDDEVAVALRLEEGLKPYYLMPIGYPSAG
jgi:nitroreductase